MPLYELTCPECGTFQAEEYCHVADDRGCRTHVCPCGSTLTHALSVGTGLTYFEEGRARVIENMTHEPITVTSHEQHKKLMKEHGVEWATRGRGNGKGGWI